MRCGQHIFWLDDEEDRCTCWITRRRFFGPARSVNALKGGNSMQFSQQEKNHLVTPVEACHDGSPASGLENGGSFCYTAAVLFVIELESCCQFLTLTPLASSCIKESLTGGICEII